MKTTSFASLLLLGAALPLAWAAEIIEVRPPVSVAAPSLRLLAQNTAAKSAAKKSAAGRETIVKYFDSSEATGTSSAVIVGQNHLAHTAQLLPLDAGGQIIGKKDASLQIERVLDNLQTVLTAVGSDFNRLVKVNVVVTRQKTVAEVQKAFAQHFNDSKPAVSFLVVEHLAHPDALVAMDAVATTSKEPGKESVTRITSSALYRSPNGSAHVAILPGGPKVYVSGQAEPGTLGEATRKTLESLRATLKHLDLDESRIVQLKAFLQPMTSVEDVEAEMVRFFDKQAVPPLVFVEWVSPSPIEIELIAAANESDSNSPDTVEYFTPPGMKASPVYSRVARINRGNTIYISGLYGQGALTPESQLREIFSTLEYLADKTGSDLRHLVKATYYVTDDESSNKLNDLRPKYFDPARPPAASKAKVAGTGMENTSATLDIIAVSRK